MMQGDVYTVYFIENLDGSGMQVLSLEKGFIKIKIKNIEHSQIGG